MTKHSQKGSNNETIKHRGRNQTEVGIFYNRSPDCLKIGKIEKLVWMGIFKKIRKILKEKRKIQFWGTKKVYWIGKVTLKIIRWRKHIDIIARVSIAETEKSQN